MQRGLGSAFLRIRHLQSPLKQPGALLSLLGVLEHSRSPLLTERSQEGVFYSFLLQCLACVMCNARRMQQVPRILYAAASLLAFMFATSTYILNMHPLSNMVLLALGACAWVQDSAYCGLGVANRPCQRAGWP